MEMINFSLQNVKRNQLTSILIQIEFYCTKLSLGKLSGLMIFNLFINDLSKQLATSCKLVQYADDTPRVNQNAGLATKLLEKNCRR